MVVCDGAGRGARARHNARAASVNMETKNVNVLFLWLVAMVAVLVWVIALVLRVNRACRAQMASAPTGDRLAFRHTLTGAVSRDELLKLAEGAEDPNASPDPRVLGAGPAALWSPMPHRLCCVVPTASGDGLALYAGGSALPARGVAWTGACIDAATGAFVVARVDPTERVLAVEIVEYFRLVVQRRNGATYIHLEHEKGRHLLPQPVSHAGLGISAVSLMPDGSLDLHAEALEWPISVTVGGAKASQVHWPGVPVEGDCAVHAPGQLTEVWSNGQGFNSTSSATLSGPNGARLAFIVDRQHPRITLATLAQGPAVPVEPAASRPHRQCARAALRTHASTTFSTVAELTDALPATAMVHATRNGAFEIHVYHANQPDAVAVLPVASTGDSDTPGVRLGADGAFVA